MEKNEFLKIIENLKQARDKSGASLAMKSIIISDGHQTFSHNYVTDAGRTDIRSISKVPLCITVGVAISRGLKIWGEPLTLSTHIFPLLEPYTKGLTKEQIGRLEKVNLEHLMTNTMGHEEGFLFSKDIKDRDLYNLMDYIVNKPIDHIPGTHFFYSNVGPYLISAMLQTELKASLADLAEEFLFRPLNIRTFNWKKYGNYVAGCTGLTISNEDLHKIGQLLINDGIWNGVRVVPTDWVNQMRTPNHFIKPTETGGRYEPHRALPKWSYGYLLWITETGNYYCDGTDGQYLIAIPERKLVITTTGAQSDMKPITECMRFLWDKNIS